MLRILKIENRKLVNYKIFWLFMAMYFILFVLIVSIVNYFTDRGQIFTKINFFAFPDVWHHVSYIASFFKLIPMVFFIIYICNEIEYRTMRQHIIDGMSKKEYLIGKVGIIFLFSLLSVIFVGIVTFIFGDNDPGITKPMFSKFIFIAALFIQTFTFLLFAMLVSLLVKKAGLSIGITLIYAYIVEPIIHWKWNNIITDHLPMYSLHRLIQNPIKEQFGLQQQANVLYTDMAFSTAYGLIFIYLFYLILKKRNL